MAYVVTQPFGGHAVGDVLPGVDAECAGFVVRVADVIASPASPAPSHESPAVEAAQSAVTAAENALKAAEAASAQG